MGNDLLEALVFGGIVVIIILLASAIQPAGLTSQWHSVKRAIRIRRQK